MDREIRRSDADSQLAKRSRFRRKEKTMRLPWLLAGICVLMALSATPIFAQYNATIQGSVVDPSEAVINSARLTLTNTSTGQAQTANADSSGRYRFVNLAPGEYKLETDASGFAKTVLNLTLITNQTLE